MDKNTDDNKKKIIYRYGNMSIEKYQKAWNNFFNATHEDFKLKLKMSAISDELTSIEDDEDRSILTFQKWPAITKLRNDLFIVKVALYQCGDTLGLSNKDYFSEN